VVKNWCGPSLASRASKCGGGARRRGGWGWMVLWCVESLQWSVPAGGQDVFGGSKGPKRARSTAAHENMARVVRNAQGGSLG